MECRLARSVCTLATTPFPLPVSFFIFLEASPVHVSIFLLFTASPEFCLFSHFNGSQGTVFCSRLLAFFPCLFPQRLRLFFSKISLSLDCTHWFCLCFSALVFCPLRKDCCSRLRRGNAHSRWYSGYAFPPSASLALVCMPAYTAPYTSSPARKQDRCKKWAWYNMGRSFEQLKLNCFAVTVVTVCASKSNRDSKMDTTLSKTW